MMNYANLYNVDEYPDNWEDLHQAAENRNIHAVQIVHARIAVQSLRMLWKRVNDKMKADKDVNSYFAVNIATAVTECRIYVDRAATGYVIGTDAKSEQIYRNEVITAWNRDGLFGLLSHINAQGQKLAEIAKKNTW